MFERSTASRILFGGDELDVVWVAAGPHAAKVVADEPSGARSTDQIAGPYMGFPQDSISPRPPVALLINATKPEPAAAAFAAVRPNPLQASGIFPVVASFVWQHCDPRFGRVYHVC